MTEKSRLTRKAEKITRIGNFGLGASSLLVVSTIVTMCASALPEANNDNDVLRTVNSVAEKTERALLAEGKESFSKDVSDFRISIDPDSSETTIQMSGTFNDGYCIVGTNAGGRKAEQGIFYSVSKDGRISRDENDCTRGVTNESVVAGPLIDKNKLSEGELSDAVLPIFGGTIGSFMLTMMTYLGASRTRKNADALESEISGEVVVINPPQEKAIDSSENIILETPLSSVPLDKASSIFQRLETIKAEWASYELDLVKVLEYPAVTNMSVPATAEFHKALRVAQSLSPEGNELSTDELSEFNRAVTDLEHRYDVMISEAQRMKWNDYSSKERVSLTMAQNLLSIAMNSASSANERQIAYKRLIKEVEGIVVLPKKAMLELENKMPAELEMDSSTKETVSV